MLLHETEIRNNCIKFGVETDILTLLCNLIVRQLKTLILHLFNFKYLITDLASFRNGLKIMIKK